MSTRRHRVRCRVCCLPKAMLKLATSQLWKHMPKPPTVRRLLSLLRAKLKRKTCCTLMKPPAARTAGAFPVFPGCTVRWKNSTAMPPMMSRERRRMAPIHRSRARPSVTPCMPCLNTPSTPIGRWHRRRHSGKTPCCSAAKPCRLSATRRPWPKRASPSWLA